VLITHSHPDHFDLGTLLRLGVDTPIHVPAVERESVLAVDVAARLEELGFRSVHRVEHFDEFGVGEMRVVGLPFFGEQPTVGERRHLEIRNQGLTWLVEMAGRRFFVIADAGRDADGDVRDLAAEVRARYGAVDTAFGSYRGFALYPVQYVFSTVSRYLPFVPAESWGERQQIMCDPDDLIDVAERCSARRLVPYAGGGAPWYWLRGLGPCLDGAGESRTWSEPPPEQVVRAAARRSGTSNVGAVPSPVEVLPLHVGDGLWF
jgi:L-ascorbate metabolism protein UlaG (beta-lactamase superfamily)